MAAFIWCGFVPPALQIMDATTISPKVPNRSISIRCVYLATIVCSCIILPHRKNAQLRHHLTGLQFYEPAYITDCFCRTYPSTHLRRCYGNFIATTAE